MTAPQPPIVTNPKKIFPLGDCILLNEELNLFLPIRNGLRCCEITSDRSGLPLETKAEWRWKPYLLAACAALESTPDNHFFAKSRFYACRKYINSLPFGEITLVYSYEGCVTQYTIKSLKDPSEELGNFNATELRIKDHYYTPEQWAQLIILINYVNNWIKNQKEEGPITRVLNLLPFGEPTY